MFISTEADIPVVHACAHMLKYTVRYQRYGYDVLPENVPSRTRSHAHISDDYLQIVRQPNKCVHTLC